MPTDPTHDKPIPDSQDGRTNLPRIEVPSEGDIDLGALESKATEDNPLYGPDTTARSLRTRVSACRARPACRRTSTRPRRRSTRSSRASTTPAATSRWDDR